MRDLSIVIDRIIAEVPEIEQDLVIELKSKKSSVRCAAPELMSMWWNEVHSTLCEYIFCNMTLNEWQEKVRKIFVGEI